MTFFAENLSQFQMVIAPLVTLLIGLCFFAAPMRSLSHIKIGGIEPHGEAFGEGRSTFAGFLIAGGVLAIATQSAKVLFILALAWSLAAFGKFLHISIDGARSKTVLLRFIMALGLAGLCYWGAETQSFNLDIANFTTITLPIVSAVMTLLFGLFLLFMPQFSVNAMRLAAMKDHRHAKGEARGNMAGFYIAAALSVLLIGGDYSLLFLGLGWATTAFGRIVSMMSDGANNSYNWLSLLIEVSLATMPLVVVFRLV